LPDVLILLDEHQRLLGALMWLDELNFLPDEPLKKMDAHPRMMDEPLPALVDEHQMMLVDERPKMLGEIVSMVSFLETPYTV
jgi:hypothetical protein